MEQILEKIIVQAPWIDDAEFAGYFDAMDRGWYTASGVEIEHRPGYSGHVPERTLFDVAEPSTIALSSPESIAHTVMETGEPLRIIAAQFQKSPLSLISRSEAPVSSVDQMEGRRVGVPPANRQLVEWLLQDRLSDPQSVELVDYDHDTRQLVDGKIDAFIDFPIDSTLAYRRIGLVPHVVSLCDLGAHLFNNVVVVHERTLRDRKQALATWLNVSLRGWQATATDPDAAVARLWSRYIISPRTLPEESVANRLFLDCMGAPSEFFSMSRAAIEKNVEVLASMGLSADGLFWSHCCDQ